jgi:hypothetical protein
VTFLFEDLSAIIAKMVSPLYSSMTRLSWLPSFFVSSTLVMLTGARKSVHLNCLFYFYVECKAR